VLVAIWPVLAIYVAVAACRAPSWCGARWGSVITSRDGRWWWVADMDKRLAVLGPHVHEGGVSLDRAAAVAGVTRPDGPSVAEGLRGGRRCWVGPGLSFGSWKPPGVGGSARFDRGFGVAPSASPDGGGAPGSGGDRRGEELIGAVVLGGAQDHRRFGSRVGVAAPTIQPAAICGQLTPERGVRPVSARADPMR